MCVRGVRVALHMAQYNRSMTQQDPSNFCVMSDEALLVLKPSENPRVPASALQGETESEEGARQGETARGNQLREEGTSAQQRASERRGEREESEYSSSTSYPSTFPSPSASSPVRRPGDAQDGGWGFNVETLECICVMLRAKAEELNQELLLRTARFVDCHVSRVFMCGAYGVVGFVVCGVCCVMCDACCVVLCAVWCVVYGVCCVLCVVCVLWCGVYCVHLLL